MAKYDPLRYYLNQQTADEVSLTFEDVGRLVGGLPPSAYEHRAWWANSRSHPNAVAWLDAGWELVDVSFSQQRVRLRRIGRAASTPGERLRKRSTGSVERLRRDPNRDRLAERQLRVRTLIDEFPDLLDYYDNHLPFDRSGQYANHRRTIDLRRQAGSVAAALADDRFLRSLYSTLESWGIGSRGSRVVPFDDFATELRRWSEPLADLDDLTIDGPELAADATGDALWRLIDGIHLVDNQAPIVALSKTIHHILPDLLPPIDRMYTQKFFGFHNPEFQYGQQRTFGEIWTHFVEIARAVNPASYVGDGWRTSRSKVIDNAIVAFVHRSRHRQGG